MKVDLTQLEVAIVLDATSGLDFDQFYGDEAGDYEEATLELEKKLGAYRTEDPI